MLAGFYFTFVFLVGLALSPGPDDPVSSPPPLRDLTTPEKALAEAGNNFGFKLFREILQREHKTNVFISPLSVSLALGMAQNGADGATREAMQKTLALSGMTIEEVNQAYRSLIELLTGLDTAVEFKIANSIWYRRTFPVEKEFLKVNNTYFHAEVSGLDFGDPVAQKTINSWVDRSTNGKISKIVDRIDPLMMMYLINAIYFKGMWTQEFDKKDTRDDQFTTAEGARISCRMMSQDRSFPYFEDSTLQAIDLPYGSGHYSMTVFLPRPEIDLDILIAQFTADNWHKWASALAKSPGELFLPKFKLEYELTLNDELTALGMGIAFAPDKADFTKINKKGKLYISEVKHKTFVDVNEEGTEAAAVTSVGMMLTSVQPAGFVMRVDRPFLFVIRDHRSGTILFMGKIVEPTL